jgi:hypothetical protein
MRLLPNSFGREDNEEPLSDELTADFQTCYLHRRYQGHQEKTPEERPQRNFPANRAKRQSGDKR